MAYIISHNTTLEFIEVYKNEPSIWNVKSNAYMDRNKKNLAYERLLKILKKDVDNATIEEVKKKIKNLRSAFIREKRKIEKSSRSGIAADEVHIPKIWYFNELNFLADGMTTEKGLSNLDMNYEEIGIEESENSEEPAIPGSSRLHTEETSRGKKRKTDKKTELLELIYNKFSKNEYREDEFDSFGKTIASKLRSLAAQSENSALLVQKLMMELIFLGKTGEITANTVISNQIKEPSALSHFSMFQSAPSAPMVAEARQRFMTPVHNTSRSTDSPITESNLGEMPNSSMLPQAARHIPHSIQNVHGYQHLFNNNLFPRHAM